MAITQQHFDHAWDHFKVHSSQRMQHWQYALTFSGAIYAVIATAAEFDVTALFKTAAIVGLVATGVFWALDHRTRDLVKASEAALKEIELDMAANNQLAPIAIFHRTEHLKGLGLSYTQAFSLLFLINAICFVGIAVGADIAELFN